MQPLDSLLAAGFQVAEQLLVARSLVLVPPFESLVLRLKGASFDSKLPELCLCLFQQSLGLAFTAFLLAEQGLVLLRMEVVQLANELFLRLEPFFHFACLSEQCRVFLGKLLQQACLLSFVGAFRF